MNNDAVQAARQPPEGFVLLKNLNDFTRVIMPAFVRHRDKNLDFGFFVEKQHCNPVGTCHGGMLMTFVDIMLGGALCNHLGKIASMPTMNLTCDLVSPAVEGDWLQSELHSIHLTRTVAYVSGAIVGPNGWVVRANGTFKLPR